MIYRTLSEAQREPGPFASWKTRVILHVALADGRDFWRTYVHDQYLNKCRRCRRAGRALNRLASTGHTCEQCGNPYCGFVRESRTCRTGTWQTMRHCWGSSGRLH